MTLPSFAELNSVLVPLAVRAGALIMDIYHADFDVTHKADASPVTEADQRAEHEILNGLAKHWPALPVVAEEQAARGEVPEGGACFFLVDPLDGTKEFIAKRDEFTVNIALVHKGMPVYGVIFAPALGALYVTLSETKVGRVTIPYPFEISCFSDLEFEEIQVRKWDQTALTAVASRSHIDEHTQRFLTQNNVVSTVSSGSSLKFCMVAEGKADLYPRFGPTMEWDTAAGHGILLAAGGAVIDIHGQPFCYGKFAADYRNEGFVACGVAPVPPLNFPSIS